MALMQDSNPLERSVAAIEATECGDWKLSLISAFRTAWREPGTKAKRIRKRKRNIVVGGSRSTGMCCLKKCALFKSFSDLT